MQTITQQLTAGQTWAMADVGSYFEILEATNPVNVRFMKGGKVQSAAEDMAGGFYSQPAGGFDRLEITSATTQIIKIGVSDGSGGQNRIAGTVDAVVRLAATVVNKPAVNVAGETVLAAANSNRAGLRVLNAGPGYIALGAPGLNFADAVIVLATGQMWQEQGAPGAAWVAVPKPNETATVKVQEMLR